MQFWHSHVRRALLAAGLAGAAATAYAQAPPARTPPRGQFGPQVISPEVSGERKITFRIFAPRAETVRLSAGDIPGNGPGVVMTKSDSGVWETTVGPVPAGAYRYNFNLDGVPVIDPRNPAASESNNNTWSLVYVPGSDVFDTRNVPHGAVSAVTYYSSALSRFRRMHVYTPPGYDQGKGKYPVFYLLHGAGDSDASWSTVGRAGFILDNLIAAGKAKPMVVVMPAGHTRSTFGPPAGGQPSRDEFSEDFVTDIMPYVEKNYRVLTDRQNRAIAGLSMGGGQTLTIALPHPEKFAYVGVFSSGLFQAFPQGRNAAETSPWEEQNKTMLDNPAKKGIKLVWFGTGKDDFLLGTSRGTVDLLKRHGYQPEFTESEGGHTWLNWRDYLQVFAPRLFR